MPVEYCDDDREYIRVKRRKTDNFSISGNLTQPKMSSLKKMLSLDKDIYSIETGAITRYIMSYQTFIGLPIDRWHYNRPADITRVQQIREWIDTSKRVPGVVSLACVDNKLVCYDANHRREALKGLSFVYPITVDILWDATDEDVKREFILINQAESVPEIYVAETPAVSEAELRPKVENFCNMFPTHRKPSPRPNPPHFSRDGLLQQFYNLCCELKISPDELMHRIDRLNREMATRDKSKLSPAVIEKCTKSGLWLFAWSRQISKTDLELI